MCTRRCMPLASLCGRFRKPLPPVPLSCWSDACRPSLPQDTAAADSMARTLINEVWEVVDQNYLDARHTGFDAAKWAALRDAALRGTYGSSAQGYRAIRQMLADGISDPYCRFITPAELAVMKKYDVTGVGLNLGTADEYVRKTGRQLARGTGQLASSEGGEEAKRCPLCCLDVCGQHPAVCVSACVQYA